MPGIRFCRCEPLEHEVHTTASQRLLRNDGQLVHLLGMVPQLGGRGLDVDDLPVFSCKTLRDCITGAAASRRPSTARVAPGHRPGATLLIA